MSPPTSPAIRASREGAISTLRKLSPTPPDLRTRWLAAFHAVRAETERRAAPLSPEDQVVQSMPDASPTKWHRAHTTWFFEQFLLTPHLPGYRASTSNSPICSTPITSPPGPRHARPQRGLLTRPDIAQVAAYRAHVDAAVERLLPNADERGSAEVLRILEIGLHHEQQHQELLLTDILHAFAQNPVAPAYDADWHAAARRQAPRGFRSDAERTAHASASRATAICFDNEGPAHQVFLQPVRIARALVTNAQWLDFMADGGYATPSLWLSDGWATVAGGRLERARLLAQASTAPGSR